MASACGPGGSLVSASVTAFSSIMTVEPRGSPIKRIPPLSTGPTTSAGWDTVAAESVFEVLTGTESPAGEADLLMSFGADWTGTLSVGAVESWTAAVESTGAPGFPDANPRAL